MIKRGNSQAQILAYAKAASTVFALNDVVTRDASGYLVRATASTPRNEILGLIQRDVLATDTDYAANTMCPVDLARTGDEFIADVSTGTAVQAMVDKRFDLDDHNSLNVNTSTKRHVEITKIISTTQVLVKFVRDGDTPVLRSYQEKILVSQFTDGGSTAGTYVLKTTIPAGAVYARTLSNALTGFAGDTTATVTIGDGTDVDRYNTGTPDWFTTAAAGIDLGVPSGTLFHADAKSVTVTVTTGSDFTLCKTNGSGAVTVTLFWYEYGL